MKVATATLNWSWGSAWSKFTTLFFTLSRTSISNTTMKMLLLKSLCTTSLLSWPDSATTSTRLPKMRLSYTMTKSMTLCLQRLRRRCLSVRVSQLIYRSIRLGICSKMSSESAKKHRKSTVRITICCSFSAMWEPWHQRFSGWPRFFLFTFSRSKLWWASTWSRVFLGTLSLTGTNFASPPRGSIYRGSGTSLRSPQGVFNESLI